MFMDLGIQPGDDFVEQVKVAIASCAVLLVIIGPEWLDVTDRRGARRLEDPEDLVRLEIAMALERGVVVIPLLVREASMPREDELTAPLAPLARRNALPMRDYGWDDALGRLVKRLLEVVDATSPRRVWLRAAWDRLASRPPQLIVIGLVLLAVAAYILIPGFPGGGDRPAAEVKVGAIYVLDGPDANANEEVLRGAQFAVDYLNGGDDGVDEVDGESTLPLKAGAGLPRLGGAQLRLVVPQRVSRCRVAPVFEGLVQRGVAAVIGAYESTITLRGIVAADHLRVPFVNAGSTVASLTRKQSRSEIATCEDETEHDPRPSPWFFRVSPDDVQAAKQFFDFLDDERIPVRRVAMLGESRDIFGNAAAAATREVAEPREITVKRFKYATVLGDDVDVSDALCKPMSRERALVDELGRSARRPKDEGVIRQLQAYDPDVVFAVGYPPDAITAVQTMQMLGYVPRAMLAYGSGYLDDTFIEGAAARQRGLRPAPRRSRRSDLAHPLVGGRQAPRQDRTAHRAALRAALRPSDDVAVSGRLHRDDGARASDQRRWLRGSRGNELALV